MKIDNQEKLHTILSKLTRVKDLLSEGLARVTEKSDVLEEAKQNIGLIEDDILGRKAEKLSKRTIYTTTYNDGFADPKEIADLNPWIELLQEYLGRDKIKRRLEKEGLWIQSNIDGEDEHLFIGEKDNNGKKIHLIRDGGTGEIRIDPKDQIPHALLRKVETIITLTTGERVRSTLTKLEFLESDNSEVVSENIPILDVFPPLGRTGGSTGHFATFTIKNISTHTAIECWWCIRAFGFEWSQELPDSVTLQPNDTKLFEFKISDHRPFQEEMQELNIVMEYNNLLGERLFTRRALHQERVPSGDFFVLKLGKFYPPQKLVDYGIKSIGGFYKNGDRYECQLEVELKGERKIVVIGMSGSLAAIWEFVPDENLQAAFNEIGTRKVRKMLIEGNLHDYMFSTSDIPPSAKDKSGLDNYKLVRDAI